MGGEDVWHYLDVLAAGPATPRERTLNRMRGLVDALGNPQHAFPSIHVTGTNGKGSTVAYAAALLAAEGARVGTYTSPHLHHVTERVTIDGKPVDEARFADAVARVIKSAPEGVDHSWFEVITAAAFVLLAEAGIDVAVIEVGALGRVDATNVLDAPVAVITNVQLDHTNRAGPTRAHIAAEKGGIVRPGATLVLGEPDRSLEAAATAAGPGRVLRTGVDYGWRNRRRTAAVTAAISPGPPGAAAELTVDLWTPWAERLAVPIGATAAYQCENAATALAAVDAFLGRPVGRTAVDKAIGSTRVGGRWDAVGHAPLLVVDGAHNPAGAAAMGRVVDEEFSATYPRILVVGVRGRRPPASLLAALRPAVFDHVVCTEPPAADACPAADLAAGLPAEPEGTGPRVHAVPAWPEAVALARRLAGPSGAVLVTGSLYLVGAVHGAATRTAAPDGGPDAPGFTSG